LGARKLLLKRLLFGGKLALCWSSLGLALFGVLIAQFAHWHLMMQCLLQQKTWPTLSEILFQLMAGASILAEDQHFWLLCSPTTSHITGYILGKQIRESLPFGTGFGLEFCIIKIISQRDKGLLS